jgi:hypothetical protein
MTAQKKTLRIGEIDVHFPDAVFATFWFMHDLADTFGVETNAEAERRLRASLAALRAENIKVDHESDYVFVHAKRADSLISALRSVEHATGRSMFAAEDLAAAAREMSAWKRPKPVQYREGDLVAVPLSDGSQGAIHVLGPRLFLVLETRAETLDALRGALAAGAGACVAGRSLSDEEIVTGEWPIVGSRRPAPPVSPSSLTDGRPTGGSVVDFLESFFGIAPWDSLFDCDEFDDWLLPDVRAEQRRLRREIFASEREKAAPNPVPTDADCPATIHLLVSYKGGPRPRIIDKPKIRSLAERLRPLARELWTGGGDGYFDLFAHVEHVAAFREAVDRVSMELRIKDDTLLECYSPFVIDWKARLASAPKVARG